MTKRRVLHALAWIVVMAVSGVARAQTLNFTDALPPSLDQIDPSLLQPNRPPQTFRAGSAIYAVISLAGTGSTIGDFFGDALRVTVSFGHQSGEGFDLVYSQDYPIQGNDAAVNTTILPVFPDKPDPKFPGYDQLMRMLSAPHKDPKLVIEVKLEASNDRFHYRENGFYYDTSAGLGRYGEWIKGAHAVANSEREAYERAHIGPRTKAVHAYRSVRSDAKLEADARKWWKTHVTGGQVLEGVKTCSELILLHDPRYHDVISEKQACVLYTYKGNGKCWAQMRRLSYRRLGKDTYDTNLVDSTYATMHVPVGDEQFDGAREYEIGCK